MTTQEPKVNDTDRLPIGEAAKVLGVDRKTLRVKCEEGEIKYFLFKGNKRKGFTGRELKRYWQANG